MRSSVLKFFACIVLSFGMVAALPAQVTPRGPLPGCFWYCYLRGDIKLLNGTVAHFDDTPGCSLYPGTKCGGVIAGKLQLPSFLFPGFDLAVLDGVWAVCDTLYQLPNASHTLQYCTPIDDFSYPCNGTEPGKR